MSHEGDKIDVLDRIGRPLIRLCGVVFIVLILIILARIGFAVATAFERAVEEGRSVPDMSGGLPGILSGLAVAVPAVGAFIVDQITRHRERTRQIDRGQARPTPPAGERFPNGGLVNNTAIESQE